MGRPTLGTPPSIPKPSGRPTLGTPMPPQATPSPFQSAAKPAPKPSFPPMPTSQAAPQPKTGSHTLAQLRALTVDQLCALRAKIFCEKNTNPTYWNIPVIIKETQDRKFIESFAVFATVINEASERIQGGLIYNNNLAPMKTQILSQPIAIDPQAQAGAEQFQEQADEYYDGPPAEVM